MIPLAYPSQDLSWSVGLPGKTSPLGALGAAEYRVIAVDKDQPDDGFALSPRPGDTVGIDVPIDTSVTVPTQVYTYDTTQRQWGQQAIVPSGATTGSGPFPLQWVTVQVPSLGWWAVGAPLASAGCLTGSILNAGALVVGAVVRGTGCNGLPRDERHRYHLGARDLLPRPSGGRK